MKKKYVKNVILIMSGGIGTRFGADKPKQYCNMNGRPVIEYVLDACKLSILTDEVVIVTAKNYVDEIKKQYGFPTTVGGENRTISLYNGLKYIKENYNCEKVIVTNAVCPLIKEEQIDKYFNLLDSYDYVLTSWKVTSTLHRYDGKLVDRNDYFHVMEPEAYNFKLLYDNYKKDFPLPYIFHQLPSNSKAFFCFDYPYTMKLTYAQDLKIAELLYHDIIEIPRKQKTLQKLNLWLSSFKPEGIEEWLLEIPQLLEQLIHRWDITSYVLNPTAFATCVYEAESSKYGKVVIKFHSPSGRFESELMYYKMSSNNFMAKLLDYDTDYRALLIKRILPGTQVKFNKNNIELKSFFEEVSNSFIKFNNNLLSIVPTIKEEFELNVRNSSKHTFEHAFRNEMEIIARKIYNNYFINSELYFLHRDLHRRNILHSSSGIFAIDPLGVIGPKEFEYTITFIIETRQSAEPIKCFNEMLDFFSVYIDRERLLAALFFIWVHKMDEYVFVKHDDYIMASWTIKMIKDLYLCDKILNKSSELIYNYILNKIRND